MSEQRKPLVLNNGKTQQIRNNDVLSSPGGIVAGDASTDSRAAIVDINSTTKGLLIPRLSTTQRDAIEDPDESLLVYDTTAQSLSQYIAGKWQYVGMQDTIDGGTF